LRGRFVNALAVSYLSTPIAKPLSNESVPCVPLETAQALGDWRNGVAEVCAESPSAETKPPPTITMKWTSGWVRDAPRVSRNCRVRAIVGVLSARSAQVTTPKPRPATLPGEFVESILHSCRSTGCIYVLGTLHRVVILDEQVSLK
jgi:hypothetical protein